MKHKCTYDTSCSRTKETPTIAKWGRGKEKMLKKSTFSIPLPDYTASTLFFSRFLLVSSYRHKTIGPYRFILLRTCLFLVIRICRAPFKKPNRANNIPPRVITRPPKEKQAALNSLRVDWLSCNGLIF